MLSAGLTLCRRPVKQAVRQPVRRDVTIVLAGLAASAFCAVAAQAADCTATTSATVTATCSDTATFVPNPSEALTRDYSFGRADSVLGGSAWIEQSWQSTPFSFSAADTSYSVKSSASHLAAYSQYERVAQFRDDLPQDLRDKLPALLAARATSPLDIWTVVNVAQSETSYVASSQQVVGLDVRLGRKAVLGVVAEQDDGSDGRDGQVAAFLKAQLWDGVMVDTRVGKGEDRNTTQDGGALSSAHTFAATKFSRAWQLGAYTVVPSVGIAVSSTTADADAGGRLSGQEVSFEQRISRKFKLEGQKQLEPFISFKQAFDSGATTTTEGDGTSSSSTLGAGLKLDATKQYSLSVSTSVERNDTQDKPEFDSRFQLKLPLN